MKKEIHLKYYKEAEVICACGNRFKVGSTLPSMKIEICSACHPFFTGKARFVDKAKRIDRFKEKVKKYQKLAGEKRKRTEEKQRKQKEAELLLQTRKK